jgi:hypothetical protein
LGYLILFFLAHFLAIDIGELSLENKSFLKELLK